jgi:hypothetical protein
LFRIELQGPVPDRIKRAVLSWAYLALFDQYGYAFCLEPAVRPVRTLLLDPSAELLGTEAMAVRPAQPDDPGRVAMAVVFSVGQVHLVGLAVDFGRAVGVVPIASDREGMVYEWLEWVLARTPEWQLDIVPIGDIVREGSAGDFARGSSVLSPPHQVVGVTQAEAIEELRDGARAPSRGRGRRPMSLRVPEAPPTELPHHLDRVGYQAVADSGLHGPRYLEDLRRVAVDGGEASVDEPLLGEEVDRFRRSFSPSERPKVLYRIELVKRDGRELPWVWARVEWPDGSANDVGPAFSAAALAEELLLAAGQRLEKRE